MNEVAEEKAMETKNPGIEPQIEHKNDNDTTQLGESKRLWVDVTSGNHILANEMVIEFVAPKIVNGEINIEIEDNDIDYSLQKGITRSKA